MTVTVEERVKSEATAGLHRLLVHYKSLGAAGQQRVEPDHFFPIDTRLLIELSGWTVDEVAMVGYSSRWEGLAAKCVMDEKRILLLRTLPDAAKRFTLAHELGHLVLHRQIPDCNCGGHFPRVLSMLSTSRMARLEYPDSEREAEVYARELLMPGRAVRRHFHQLFGVDRLRASSGLAAKFAPRARQTRPLNLRAAAEEIAQWSDSPLSSLVDFFGVSSRAMSSRLIGLYLVY